MGSVRRLIVVAATILAISVLAPSVSAHSDRNFHLAKTCSDDGSTCTVKWSNSRQIPAGSVINYSGDSLDALTAVINVKHGTATGHCAISAIFADPAGPGHCVFNTGTGSLRGFHLNVLVTYDAVANVWFWDGTSWFSHHHHHHGHH